MCNAKLKCALASVASVPKPVYPRQHACVAPLRFCKIILAKYTCTPSPISGYRDYPRQVLDNLIEPWDPTEFCTRHLAIHQNNSGFARFICDHPQCLMAFDSLQPCAN